MNQMELVLEELKKQIGNLSEEKALYFALATSKQQENDELRKEVEALKQEIEELKKSEEGADENEL